MVDRDRGVELMVARDELIKGSIQLLLLLKCGPLLKLNRLERSRGKVKVCEATARSSR